MSAEEHAGPSKKRVRVESDYDNNYCGLDRGEVRQIKTFFKNDDIFATDSEEEPFMDSGSEYLPSDVDTDEQESSESEVKEISFEDRNGPDVVINDDNLDADVTDYRDLIITWTKHDFVPKLHAFDDSNSGVKNEHLTEGSPEIEFFLDLFTEDIAQYIVVETNRYAIHKNEKKWKQLNLGEFFTFIALTMLMSRNKKLEVKDYWSVDPLLYTPAFGKYMARDRYLQILKNLHFANNEEADNNNRLHKVQYVLEEIKRRFKSQFYPFQNLVIDESMILFKGRLSFKQYIKTKRHRFGIKLYVLCDCDSGIVLDFIVYVGKDTYAEQENITGLGASGNIVAMLMKSYLNYGHSLYTDNFYSSPILSNYLFERTTNSCGTVRSNRLHMPKIDEKLKKGDVAFRNSDICSVMKWKDRRDVTMITTMHENKMITLDRIDRATNENVKKPMCVVDYNSKMGAVDRSDMLISSIDSLRKSIKWYKKLFIHTLDICVLNSHGMFSTKHPIKYPLAKFQLNLIRQLLERYMFFDSYCT